MTDRIFWIPNLSREDIADPDPASATAQIRRSNLGAFLRNLKVKPKGEKYLSDSGYKYPPPQLTPQADYLEQGSWARLGSIKVIWGDPPEDRFVIVTAVTGQANLLESLFFKIGGEVYQHAFGLDREDRRKIILHLDPQIIDAFSSQSLEICCVNDGSASDIFRRGQDIELRFSGSGIDEISMTVPRPDLSDITFQSDWINNSVPAIPVWKGDSKLVAWAPIKAPERGIGTRDVAALTLPIGGDLINASPEEVRGPEASQKNRPGLFRFSINRASETSLMKRLLDKTQPSESKLGIISLNDHSKPVRLDLATYPSVFLGIAAFGEKIIISDGEKLVELHNSSRPSDVAAPVLSESMNWGGRSALAGSNEPPVEPSRYVYLLQQFLEILENWEIEDLNKVAIAVVKPMEFGAMPLEAGSKDVKNFFRDLILFAQGTLSEAANEFDHNLWRANAREADYKARLIKDFAFAAIPSPDDWPRSDITLLLQLTMGAEPRLVKVLDGEKRFPNRFMDLETGPRVVDPKADFHFRIGNSELSDRYRNALIGSKELSVEDLAKGAARWVRSEFTEYVQAVK